MPCLLSPALNFLFITELWFWFKFWDWLRLGFSLRLDSELIDAVCWGVWPIYKFLVCKIYSKGAELPIVTGA